MRLFVGLELDAAVVRRLEEFSLELRRRVEETAPDARLSWVPADRLHVTVRFIGQVDDARAAAIGTALAPVLDLHPFSMRIAGAGTFPPRGAPRVFWAGVHASPGLLQELERQVSGRLAPHGVTSEDRSYLPHITLARVKDAKGLRASALVRERDRQEFGSSAVEAITLFESRPSAQGVRYLALQRTRLTPART